ncbi:MAG: hypothetical protein ACR2NZ_18190, partial [Rubripirellula sp.]
MNDGLRRRMRRLDGFEATYRRMHSINHYNRCSRHSIIEATTRGVPLNSYLEALPSAFLRGRMEDFGGV